MKYSRGKHPNSQKHRFKKNHIDLVPKSSRKKAGQKISKMWKNNLMHVDNIGKWNIGKRRTDEAKEKYKQKALEQFKDGMLQETKRKIRKKLTGYKQTTEHVQKRVETRLKNNTYICTEKTKTKMRKARANQKFPFSNTSIEIKLQNALTEQKIIFQTQKYQLLGTPDIFIKPNICIFADGDYWHNLPGAQERDAYVNKTLIEQGYKILRFWEHEIHTNIDICVNKIINKINEY